MTIEELVTRFKYHSPNSATQERHATLRAIYLELASEVVGNTPSSREQSLAVTALEESLFWANAAIAREGK